MFKLPTLKSLPFLNELQNKPKQPKSVAQSISDETLEAIHAFRTITTMLSLIQPTKQDNSSGKQPNIAKPLRGELRILDALAALIIRGHGVAAVVSKPKEGSQTEQVLVSVTNLNRTKEQLITLQPLFGTILNAMTAIFASQNPRKKKQEKSTSSRR
jgi:hypothetical protein